MATTELALLELVKGHQGQFGKARLTTIRAGQSLVRRLQGSDMSLDDLRQETDGEVIILKQVREDDQDRKERIDYADTPTTCRYRDEVRRINRWLAQADISFDPAAAPDRIVDEADRRLWRCFNNGSFEQGGRLFGGFWLRLKKQERAEGITINGEPVVALDYGQVAPRLLYGQAGASPPDRDLYLLPGLEQHREGVKKVFNSLLYASKPIERFPQHTRPLFPQRVSVKEVIAQITALHQSISHLFYKGIGLKLMFQESQILVAVLLALIDQGIVALPIHDALLVEESNSEVTRDTMLQVFSRLSGVAGKVVLDD